MKKIRQITLLFLIIILMAHAGCMSTTSPARGGLSGTVTDAAGNPLSGVKITTADSATMSDIYGNWALESLSPQMTEITASRDQYQSQKLTIEVLSGEILENIVFVLPADSELYDVQVSSISSTKANVTFYTRNNAVGYIKYGINALLNQTTPVGAEGKLHQFNLENLTPASSYRFKCVATDELGRALESETKNFTTAYTARGDAPSGLAIAKTANSNLLQISWNQDSGSDLAGFALYRSQSSQGPFMSLGTGIIRQNAYADLDVQPGVKYYYRVTRLSASGDESPPSAVESFLMPGVITQNAVWTVQESPYLLTGDLTVAAGASLVIDKGVSIGVAIGDQWDADSATDLIDISVKGTLMVQGTAASPVTITSMGSAPQAGDWNGITFENIADLSTSMVKGLKLSFAENGIKGVAGLPNISESSIYNCRVAGVVCESGRKDVILRTIQVDTCASGISVSNSPDVNVKILDSTLSRCIYGIVCRDNKYVEIKRNTIALASVSGIDVGNSDATSKVYNNIVGYGSSGSGIICRGNDEIRRNTVQSNIGIEIKAPAEADVESAILAYNIRSNLILADKSRNCVGVFYSGKIASATHTINIQYNAVWNVATSRKYIDSEGASFFASAYVSADISLSEIAGAALSGGNPFAAVPGADFSYVPSSVELKGTGYDGDTIGAEDASG